MRARIFPSDSGYGGRDVRCGPVLRTSGRRGVRTIAGWGLGAATIGLILCSPLVAFAQQDAAAARELPGPISSAGGAYPVDFLWTVVAAILVYWMQAGFGMVEAGFTRAKNAVNILMKNLTDFSLGAIIFWAVGFGLMFGETNGLFGTTGFFLSGYGSEPWSYAFLLFQTVFAGTAATIVSGAVAERIQFRSYIIYTILITGFIYPVFGSWAWGGLFRGSGWLEAPDGGLLSKLGLPGFIDFAGSTVVHSVGGWAALAGAMVAGPRIGKYNPDGTVNPIVGHSLPLSALGVMILWMGWFGFNAGSTTGVTGGDTEVFGGAGKAMALIAVNTNISAASGAIGAMCATWWYMGKPDAGITFNGALSGLVAITAPCSNVAPWSAVVIGFVAGILVFAAVLFFDKFRVDDPCGAISVHGVNGAWGTLAAAIFHIEGFTFGQLVTQLIGILVCFAWTFSTAFIVFKTVDKTIGLRVTPEQEVEGLDLVCHGAIAYPEEYVFADEAGPEDEYGPHDPYAG